MKRKLEQNLPITNVKKPNISESYSLFSLFSDLLVHTVNKGVLTLKDVQSLRTSCKHFLEQSELKKISALKKHERFIHDVRMNSQIGLSKTHLFYNQADAKSLLIAPKFTRLGQFVKYTIPPSLEKKMGRIKEIFPGSFFTLLHCEKGLFGLSGYHCSELFQIDTKAIEQQHGKINQVVFNNNSGFLLCQNALLGFGKNDFCQLGFGEKSRHPFAIRLNLPEEIFKNLKPLAQETFNTITQAGKILKIVNDSANSMIICEKAIFCCGDSYFEHLAISISCEFVAIKFNPEKAGQFIQASIGERHTLLLYKNKEGEYELYGCGINHQRQLGMVDRHFRTSEFIKIDFPKNKGKPLMILADDFNSYILCEEGLLMAGLDCDEWELSDNTSSSSGSEDSDDPWKNDSLHPWTSMDEKFNLFKKKGKILKIIPELGVLCENGMFVIPDRRYTKGEILFHETTTEPMATVEFKDNLGLLSLNTKP